MIRRPPSPPDGAARPRASAPVRRGGHARQAPSNTALRLRIGRLVLDGMSRADERRVTAAMASHLAALIDRTPGLDWSRVPSLGRLDGGTVSSRATPDEIGQHLATRIFGGLMRDV